VPGFDAFGWGELFSMIAVIISFATICVSLFGKSAQNTRNEQRMFDKLDSLGNISDEIKSDVRTVSKQVSSYGVRLGKAETDIQALKDRVDRLETKCDDRFMTLHDLRELGGTD